MTSYVTRSLQSFVDLGRNLIKERENPELTEFKIAFTELVNSTNTRIYYQNIYAIRLLASGIFAVLAKTYLITNPIPAIALFLYSSIVGVKYFSESQKADNMIRKLRKIFPDLSVLGLKGGTTTMYLFKRKITTLDK